MIIKIKHQTDFVIVNQQPIRSKKLSWRAKGLLTYLMSLPHDWEVALVHLAKVSKDSKDATRTALNELIGAGYVTRIERRDGGKFMYDYQVCDTLPTDTSTTKDLQNTPQTVKEVSKNLHEFQQSAIASFEVFEETLKKICPHANPTYYHKKIMTYSKSKALIKEDWIAYLELWIQGDIEKNKLKVIRGVEKELNDEESKQENILRNIKRIKEDVERQLTQKVTYSQARWDSFLATLRTLWKIANDEQRTLINQIASEIHTLKANSPE